MDRKGTCGAGKNSGGQNNRLVEKKAGLRETSLVFHLYILIKPFSFWTSLPSFWLPFLTPFIGFSSFQRVEYFIRTPEALVLSYLLFLSKNMVREPQIMLGAPILFHFFKETQHIF
ncbi:MAG TPA: hypothetical protein VK460_02255 [Burkholderiales bacterium]|nr:hypothetical protein [Burkholderiales bacterium]